MILASARDYMYNWQIPIILVFVVGSVFVGGWTLYKVFLKRGQKFTLGRTILGVTLAELGGGAVGGSVYMAVNALQVQGLERDANFQTVGLSAGIAIPVFLFGFIHVLYIMFSLPWKGAVKMAIWPLVTVLAFGAVVGAAAGIPSLVLTWGQREREGCLSRLKNIHGALQAYRDIYRTPPPNLELLLDTKIVEKAVLWCPQSGLKQTGFFYMSRPANSPSEKNAIEACDWRNNHSGYRAVLLVNGDAQWMSEDEFRSLEGAPANEAFSKALGAEETKRK